MASTLRFVESDLATLRLALDWIEGESDLSSPEHIKQWSESVHADGKRYRGGHWSGRTLTLALHIHGTSLTNRNSKARALIAELVRENILEFSDGTNAFWIKTYPMDRGQITGLIESHLESAYVLHPFMVKVPADPFWFGDWETLTPVANLIPNGDMEDFTGDDPDDWTVTETAGGGAATVSKETVDLAFGTGALSLVTTAADSVAKVETTTAIPITKTEHYNIVFNYFRESGADSLDCVIRQFSAAHADLADDITISPTSTADDVWYLSSTVIHPAGAGGNDWHADCAEVKIYLRNTGAAADINVDNIWFVNSELLSGNELTNALGITIPPASILGDVPAPVDIYLDKLSTATTTAAIHVGGRKNYDADFVARLENTLGTAAYSNLASGGAYRTQPSAPNLVSNPGFETFTGTAGSNTEDWTDWTESRDPSGEILATTQSRSGSYALKFFSDFSDPITQYVESAYIAVNAANDYVISVWHILQGYSPGLMLSLRCYDAVPALVGTITMETIWEENAAWKQSAFDVASASWPAGTTQVKIRIFVVVPYQPDESGTWVIVDDVNLSLAPVQAITETYSDYIKGETRPFLHYKISTAASSKTLALQGKIKDDAAGDITSLAEQVSLTVSMPDDWTYQKLTDNLPLPTSRIPDSADTSGIEQYLEVDFDSSLAGGLTISIDDLALIPMDNGYAEIPAESNQYLILDSNSQVPALLSSLDGTIDTAIQYSEPGALRRIFTVDPQNGSNFGALMDYRDSSGNAVGQWLADVTLKYRPRYLAVK